jgi:hypothetical protein
MRYVGSIQTFAQCPKCALVFGLIFAIPFTAFAIFNWSHVQTLPERPESIPLSQIASKLESQSRIWVVIPSVEWDCDNVVHEHVARSYNTEAIFTNPEHTIMGVATFSGRKTCEEIAQTELSGEVYFMNSASLAKLPERGFDLAQHKGANTFVNVCTYCGRYNSLLGIWVCGILALAGLSLYPISLSMNRRYRLTGRLPYERY